MASLLSDIDATCASLGHCEGSKYNLEPDAVQNLKHLIWILRRDGDTHEYRRHLGRAQVLQTDLIPMLVYCCKQTELSDVLLRLLVNLTNPALLLYGEQTPSDGPGRRIYLEVIEHLQGYKQAMAQQTAWAPITARLQAVLETDAAERSEEMGLLIERVLVLARNVLQVPASPETERRADSDASLHDQVLWALQQAGLLDIVLYITSSIQESQYHLHTLEIISLMYREQTAASLADASLQRSTTEKERDEKELIAARNREKAKVLNARHLPPTSRHSRFGGTFVIRNLKSISDNDVICHKAIMKPEDVDFNDQKKRIKRPKNKMVLNDNTTERRSAFSVRLFLREFCLEILSSAYNPVTREVRRSLNSSGNAGDESYLLWAVRFFMEFNRLNGFQLNYISETLNASWFHWVLGRAENGMEMLLADRKQNRLWARRLHLAVQAYRELLMSLQVLDQIKDEQAQALSKSLQGNVFYILEYRETILQLLLHYEESKNSKAYLRDLIETAHVFFRMMERYCKSQGNSGGVVVQQKKKQRRKTKKPAPKKASRAPPEDRWASMAYQVSAVLTGDGAAIPTDVAPFDAAKDVDIDEQKVDCMKRIQILLDQHNFEEAIGLLRAGREVWPENDSFGAMNLPPEEELMALNDIYMASLGNTDEVPAENSDVDDDNDDDDEEEEEDGEVITETDFKFSEFENRLANPKIVRACALLLADWRVLPVRATLCAVKLLHRVVWNCKVPGMLFQASLFRTFQCALAAPRDAVHEEVRKLAKYVVRQFVTVAENNPKVYAELLFWKSSREAVDLENGYAGDPHGVSKKAWTEDEEQELRRLFMMNQENPENDTDVIDWLCENLVDTTRTRRQVMRKLRELGLVFTRPTKKSSAQANPKSAWSREQDQQLDELYQEHRTGTDTLKMIAAAFEGRSDAVIVRRMIALGLIENKRDIMPVKKFRAKNPMQKKLTKLRKNPDSGSDSDTSPKPVKNNTKSVKLNNQNIRSLMAKLDYLKDGLEWLSDSITDAADDINDEDSDDDNEGVPLVPLYPNQVEAIADPTFQELLTELGIQAPIEHQELYWRIPGHFTADDLKVRANLLAGSQDIDDSNNGNEDTENNGIIDHPIAGLTVNNSDADIDTNNGVISMLQSDNNESDSDSMITNKYTRINRNTFLNDDSSNESIVNGASAIINEVGFVSSDTSVTKNTIIESNTGNNSKIALADLNVEDEDILPGHKRGRSDNDSDEEITAPTHKRPKGRTRRTISDSDS